MDDQMSCLFQLLIRIECINWTVSAETESISLSTEFLAKFGASTK